MEIKPSLVLDFLLEKLNKETGNNHNGLSFLIQPSNFNRKKEVSFNEFMKYFNNNFNSIISKYFVGIIKTKRICMEKGCSAGIYSFNLEDEKSANFFILENKLSGGFIFKRQLLFIISFFKEE